FLQVAGAKTSGASAIIALDPATGATQWTYAPVRLTPSIRPYPLSMSVGGSGNTQTGQARPVLPGSPRGRGRREPVDTQTEPPLPVLRAVPARDVEVTVPGPMAAAGGRLYAVVSNVLTALDEKTGMP